MASYVNTDNNDKALKEYGLKIAMYNGKWSIVIADLGLFNSIFKPGGLHTAHVSVRIPSVCGNQEFLKSFSFYNPQGSNSPNKAAITSITKESLAINPNKLDSKLLLNTQDVAGKTSQSYSQPTGVKTKTVLDQASKNKV